MVNSHIANTVGVNRPTVLAWRGRFPGGRRRLGELSIGRGQLLGQVLPEGDQRPERSPQDERAEGASGPKSAVALCA